MQSLQARLLAGGFPHVNFRIINSKETANNTHHVELLRHHAGHIPVFQQTSDTNHVWQTIIEGGIDHVLVLDSCGRLSYQVISPWSLIEYPYVKAAVLSTYRDDPCGPCNVTDIQETESLETENSTYGTTQDMQETPQPTETMENTSTQVEAENSFTPIESILENNSSHEITEPGTNQHRSLSSPRNGIPTQLGKSVRTMPTEKNKHDKVEEDTLIPETMQVTLSPLVERSDGTVPLKVIIRDHHTHLHEDGTISEYEYLVLQTGNPEYHGHLESEENVHLLPPDKTTVEVDVDVIPVSGNHSNTIKKHSESGQTEIDESSEEKKLKKIKHKGKKYPKKVIEKASEEIKDIKNEEKILKNMGKSIQLKQNQGNSQEVTGSEEDDIVKPKTTKNKAKKIKTKQKVSQQHNKLDEIDRTSIHKERQEESELQDPLFINESQENSREKDQATLENSKENTFTDEETSSSEVSQDIRKHNKPKPSQSFENNTLHFNRVIHKQKPTWHNNKHKVVTAIKEINNTDHEHLKKMKINKKIITHISRNDTISKDITLEDRGNQLVKNIEVHKKKHYTKKGKLHSVENYMSSTHVPIPIAWHNHDPIIDGNINLIDESKPSDQYKSAALIKTADSTEDDDDENLQWIDEEPVATNTENLKDKTLERIRSEESEENSVRGEDVIMHYSKLLKWIEFPL